MLRSTRVQRWSKARTRAYDLAALTASALVASRRVASRRVATRRLSRWYAAGVRAGDAWELTLNSVSSSDLPSWHAAGVEDGRVVYNLATQQRPGRDARLDAIATSVAGMLLDAEARGLDRVGVPRLGTGIGGLAWPDVATVLLEAAAGSSVTLVVMSRAQVRR